MQSLEDTSRVVADDLRKAEHSINLAARDTAQFLLTTLDATEAQRLSPAMTQRTIKAIVAALGALVEGQEQMALRAHTSIKKVGQQLGLDETSWGEPNVKPNSAVLEDELQERPRVFEGTR